ncbi:MAG: MFS transporter [Arcicella sp.]|nr:MFS transporter [Arcicella sp.]
MKNLNYAWVVLIALFFIYLASNGFGFNTLPLWYPSLTTEFNLAKGQIQQAPTIMLVLVAFLSPIFGFMLDKWNPKMMMLIGVVGLSALFLGFSKISSFSELRIFYALYAVFLCFGGILTSMYLINKWFSKYRGIAVGIFLNASSLGAAIFNPWSGKLIALNGWRGAEWTMSVVMVTLLILPWIFIRNHVKTEIISNVSESKSEAITLKYVAKTPSFYILLLITGTLWYCINGLLFNKDSYLNELHKTVQERASFASLFFLCGFLGKICFGFLSDKFSKKGIMLISIANLLLGSWLLKESISHPELVKWVAIVYGFGYSGAFTMIQVLIADFYMGKNYGIILGIFTMVDTLAGSAGIFLVGKSFKDNNSYLNAFDSMMILCAVTLVATFLVKKPVLKLL